MCPASTLASRATIRGSWARAWSTNTAAAGESRLPGRPIALRMSCSWAQMSKVRIIATVAAVAGPNGPAMMLLGAQAGAAQAGQPLAEDVLQLGDDVLVAPAAAYLDRPLGRGATARCSGGRTPGAATSGSRWPSSIASTPATCAIWSCTVQPGHSVCSVKSASLQLWPRSTTARVVWAIGLDEAVQVIGCRRVHRHVHSLLRLVPMATSSTPPRPTGAQVARAPVGAAWRWRPWPSVVPGRPADRRRGRARRGPRRPRRAGALGPAGRARHPRRRGRADRGPARARRDDHPRDHRHQPPGHRHPLGLRVGRRVGGRRRSSGWSCPSPTSPATPLDDPTFGAQFQSFVLSIEVLRVAAISLGLALVVAIGASVARHRGRDGRARGAERAGGPAARARRPRGRLGQPRHGRQLPGGPPGRLVLWVGGLLGLVVLRPLLGKGLAVSVARYSTLAGWCFALVALSGVQNAWIRLGSLSALGSPYGVLVIGKVVALGVLGLAGLAAAPRRRRPDGDRRGRPRAVRPAGRGRGRGHGRRLRPGDGPVPQRPTRPRPGAGRGRPRPGPDRLPRTAARAARRRLADPVAGRTGCG